MKVGSGSQRAERQVELYFGQRRIATRVEGAAELLPLLALAGFGLDGLAFGPGGELVNELKGNGPGPEERVMRWFWHWGLASHRSASHRSCTWTVSTSTP